MLANDAFIAWVALFYILMCCLNSITDIVDGEFSSQSGCLKLDRDCAAQSW